MRGILLHTVGVRGDTTMANIRRHHVEHNGWADVGYHFGIRKDGRVETGRSLSRAGAHAQGANDTIGICVYGDGDREEWTLAQWDSAIAVCADLCRAHKWTASQVAGHREVVERFGGAPTTKTCPGKLINLSAVRATVAAALAVSHGA